MNYKNMRNNQMKRAVVTGATSFLGRNVVEGLLNNGYEVYAFVRKSSKTPLKFEHENLRYIYGTLDELEIIRNHIDNANIFIHFAWAGSGSVGRNTKDIQMSNIDYSLKALKLAIILNCTKFIFPGSQAEYGKINGLISEKSECNPLSFYGQAKLEFSKKAMSLCENKTIEFIHLRIFSVYGYGDRDGTLVDSCIKAFNNNKTIELGPCSQNWNYLYITDFVNILLMLIERECPTGTYNIASPETRVLKDFVKIIYDISNKTGTYIFEEKNADNPEGSPELNPSIAKLKNYIGDYKFISFNKGIKELTNISDENESISVEE